MKSVLFALLLAPAAAMAQHDQHHQMAPSNGQQAPMQGGQAAFAAIAEIVRILESDPKTDWSKVNLEALRSHLIDMDAVALRARSVAENIPGGARFDVTGDQPTAASIRRVLGAHAHMLDEMPDYKASVEEIPDGVRLVVTSKRLDDAAIVARIRGLGFAGLWASGDHHTRHHLAIARGEGHEAHHR